MTYTVHGRDQEGIENACQKTSSFVEDQGIDWSAILKWFLNK